MQQGLMLMLKSMGFDPATLQAQIQGTVTGLQTLLKNLNDKMDKVINQNEQILAGQKEAADKQEKIWQSLQTALRMTSQVALAPQPPQPPQPQPNQPPPPQ